MTDLATIAGVSEEDYLTRPTALYSLYDYSDVLLYVGIGFDPEVRWAFHAREKDWWPDVDRKEVVWYPNRLAAMDAEIEAIETLAPVHNVAGVPAPPPAEPRGVPKGTGSAAERVAEDLRQQILSGAIRPRDRFPSESELRQTYELSRATIRIIVGILRNEGLILVRHGYATRVRRLYEKQRIKMTGVKSIEIRMPTRSEREQADIEEGVPVWVVERAGREAPELLPGNRWQIGRPRSDD